MKQIFEVKDKGIIQNLLDEMDFGTLSLCRDNIPYSVPLNFVYVDDVIYFHGAKKGKKVDIFTSNDKACFCVAKEHSFIPSYFSVDDEKACPATQFFKSVLANGEIKIVSDFDEKAKALQKLMEKMQKEGKYIALDKKEVYEKMIKATLVYKLVISDISCKFKFGQNFSDERFSRVLEHLKQRDSKIDKSTIKEMERL
ncbi:MAG: pyridoxamine 5'-phosphate oxidase family protein [Arcobacter sp.]|nr:pyridoxamine 5'-phosphate oxidase family protein [Arcobacter sp.]